jgi:hypothetical protein
MAERKHKRLSESEKELIRELKKQGKGIRKILQEVDSSYRTVSRVLQEAGLTDNTGENHPDWNGGRRIDKNGYVCVHLPIGHPLRYKDCTWILEHRLIMSAYLGRRLESFESVHHINGIRSDNRIENLQLRTSRHGPGVIARCRTCGSHDIMFESLEEGG